MSDRIYSKDEVEKDLNSKGYYLLSNYTKLRDDHKFKDINGFLYDCKLYGIFKNNTSPQKFHKNNPYTIDNIKTYIKNNKINVELLSDSYISNTSPLLFRCRCGKEYNKSWNSFFRNNYCRSCSIENTRQEYISEEWKNIVQYFKSKNLTLISNSFKKDSDRIKYICPIHKEYGIQSATWTQFKHHNTGCPFCARKENGKLKRIPEKELIKITEEKGFIYDHVEYNSEIKKTYIYFLCKKHLDKGIQFITLADMKKSSGRCRWCTHRKMDENFLESEVQKDRPNIKIIGKYKNSTQKIKCYCGIHDYEFYMAPCCLMQGQSCPECGKESSSIARLKTDDDFKKEVYLKYGDKIEILSDYNKARKKVLCKCNIHNKEFYFSASTLIHSAKQPCPECRSEDIRNRCLKSNKEFLSQLKEINPNIQPLEEYIDDHTKIKCICKIHNYKWMASPNKILHRRTGCPKCSSTHNENMIASILDKWGLKYIMQKRFEDCKDKSTLPFDLYLYENNTLIEYDGEQHYKIIPRGNVTKEQAELEFLKTKKHDEIKNEYCIKNNITLIRVPYWEADDMEYYLFDELVKNNVLIENVS